MGTHTKEKVGMSAKGMLRKARRAFELVSELPRDTRGLQSRIPIADCLMSALALFGLKYPSLLQFNQNSADPIVQHNLKSLYDVEKVPCDTYMRERLDQVDPRELREAFISIFSLLQRGKKLESYKFIDDAVLVACDGTGMFSSDSIHCENCCEKYHTKSKKTTYYHQMLGAVLIHPDQKEVFPFCPEPISKNDGETKNDCEQNAMKRFLEDWQREHPRLKVIFTQDALGSKGPHLKRIKKMGAHFIVGVKPKGNKALFSYLEGIELQKRIIETKKETIELSWINKIPLNDAHYDFEVNFVECIVKDKRGKAKGRFTWVTDIEVTEENVYKLSRGGRARWKVENETFNTLKNQGYQFEHNFGHGYKNLSHVLGLLMFLAFLIDQVQQHCCGLFQKALEFMISKTRFWKRLHVVFMEFYIDSWEDLFTWLAGKHGGKMAELLDSS